MKKWLSPLIALLLAAGLLWGMGFVLAPIKAERQEAELQFLCQTLLQAAGEFTPEPTNGQEGILSAWKSDAGHVVLVRTNGYVDAIDTMVGVTNDGRVAGITIRNMHETYGLGMQALTDHDFLAQFLCTSGDASVPQSVDAITGATVTSRAIARAVNQAVAFVTGTDATTEATSWGG